MGITTPEDERITALEKARTVIQALENKKAEDVKVIDINEVSTLADYFIIASGSNKNQLQAMTDEVDEKLSRAGYHPLHIEGNHNATWVLMDYGDVIVHIFDREQRLFYDLERIWRDGKPIDPSDLKMDEN